MKNIKIRTKLLGSFLLVVFLTAFIGYMGINSTKKIEKADIQLYENITVPLSDLTNLATSFQRIRVNVRDAIFSSDTNEREMYFTNIKELKAVFLTSLKNVELTLLTEKGKLTFQSTSNSFNDYVAFIPEIEELLTNNDVNKAIELMRGKMKVANDSCQASIDLLQKLKVDFAKNASLENAALASRSTTLLIAMIVLVLVISIALGYIIAHSIQKTIRSVVSESQRLTDAALQGKLSVRGEPEKINFEFREIIIGFNNILDAVIAPLNVAADYVEKISKGMTPPKITENYNGDFNTIKNNLNTLIDALQLVIESTKKVAAGNLDVSIVKRSEYDELLLALADIDTGKLSCCSGYKANCKRRFDS